MPTKKRKRWTTKSLMVDIETGEIIEPEHAHKYYKLSKEIQTYDKRNTITRHIFWHCRPTKQLELFH